MVFFVCLHTDLETIFLEQDKLLAILPENHKLANCDKISVASLCNEPFMLLEKGAKTEISEIFERCALTPNTHFTTWDDYAVMSMVEQFGCKYLTTAYTKTYSLQYRCKRIGCTCIPKYRACT